MFRIKPNNSADSPKSQAKWMLLNTTSAGKIKPVTDGTSKIHG